jgi:hypothetical protein
LPLNKIFRVTKFPKLSLGSRQKYFPICRFLVTFTYSVWYFQIPYCMYCPLFKFISPNFCPNLYVYNLHDRLFWLGGGAGLPPPPPPPPPICCFWWHLPTLDFLLSTLDFLLSTFYCRLSTFYSRLTTFYSRLSTFTLDSRLLLSTFTLDPRLLDTLDVIAYNYDVWYWVTSLQSMLMMMRHHNLC